MELSRGDALAAIKESEAALAIAGQEMKAIGVFAKSTLGVAELTSGKAGQAKRHCQEAVDLANTLGDPLPLSHALLALAQVAYASGDFRTAADTAERAQGRFATARQLESEWRCWLLIWLAASPNTDRKIPASEARQVLARLESEWGAENYRTYRERSDVRSLMAELDQSGR